MPVDARAPKGPRTRDPRPEPTADVQVPGESDPGAWMEGLLGSGRDPRRGTRETPRPGPPARAPQPTRPDVRVLADPGLDPGRGPAREARPGPSPLRERPFDALDNDDDTQVGYQPGRRNRVDARAAFAADAPGSKPGSKRFAKKDDKRGKGRADDLAPEIDRRDKLNALDRIPGYPRRSADGLTTVSIVIAAALGLAMLGVVENSVLNGEITGASNAEATGDTSSAAPRADNSRRPRPNAQPPVQNLNDDVRDLAIKQRGPAAGTQRTPLSGAARFNGDKTWALGTTAMAVADNSEAMPQAALYLAQWTGDQWRIALSGTPEFGRMLVQAPAQLMAADERRILTRFNQGGAQSAKPAGLMLPWRTGQTWAMSATALTGQTSRPLGAVAFRGGDGQVLAAGPGRLYKFCATAPGRGFVMVIHPNGAATTYYHLTNVIQVRDGSPVARGDVLGRIGVDRPCGGAPVGRPEVQFGLRGGNEDMPFDGLTIGGWTFRERAQPLIGWAQRGPRQILPGGLLRNFGPVAPPAVPEQEDPGDATGRPQTPGQTGQGLPELPVTPGRPGSTPEPGE